MHIHKEKLDASVKQHWRNYLSALKRGDTETARMEYETFKERSAELAAYGPSHVGEDEG